MMKGMQSIGLFFQLGITLAGPMVAGVLVGNWIDGKFDTGRIWTIIFLLFGIYTGVTGAWQMIRDEMKRKK